MSFSAEKRLRQEVCRLTKIVTSLWWMLNTHLISFYCDKTETNFFSFLPKLPLYGTQALSCLLSGYTRVLNTGGELDNKHDSPCSCINCTVLSTIQLYQLFSFINCAVVLTVQSYQLCSCINCTIVLTVQLYQMCSCINFAVVSTVKLYQW